MQRMNKDIKSGDFKQIYLLYGDERYLRRQYKERLWAALGEGAADDMNMHSYEGKNISVEEIIDLAETLPFLASRRVIFIEDSGWFKTGNEKMAAYLASLNETTYFVFVESEVDKRGKLFKLVQSKGYAANFEPQDEETLMRWVAGILKKEGKKISFSTARLFLSKTGMDMDNIYMELEKLICYCLDKEVVEAEDVEAVCTEVVGNHIFDMINAIANGRRREALELYYDLLTLKEPPMRILVLLARQYHLMLQVKTLKEKGFDQKSIGAKVGLHPGIVGKYMTQASRFRTWKLEEAIEKCVEAEEAVKTGRMNDVMSVEVLIMSVL